MSARPSRFPLRRFVWPVAEYLEASRPVKAPVMMESIYQEDATGARGWWVAVSGQSGFHFRPDAKPIAIPVLAELLGQPVQI